VWRRLVCGALVAGIVLAGGVPVSGVSARSAAAASAGPIRRVVVLGHSVRGRPIRAIEVRAGAASRSVLVVGAVHGNETAGIGVVRALARGAAIPGVDLWVIPDLNPDGVVAGTRQNAHLVDLNRNFPRGWRRLGRPGELQYSGPRPLSEPETRVARALILRIRPRVTIWFHQPLGITVRTAGRLAPQRHFAEVSGLPLRRYPCCPGNASRWQNAVLPGTSAFVVELPAGPLRGRERLLRALRAAARS
jgi:murein peptide amidase A